MGPQEQLTAILAEVKLQRDYLADRALQLSSDLAVAVAENNALRAQLAAQPSLAPGQPGHEGRDQEACASPGEGR